MKGEISFSYRRSMRSARASVEVEGFKMSEEQMELVEKKVKGEITHDVFVTRAKQIAKGWK